MKNSKTKFFLLSLLMVSGSCISANVSLTDGHNGAAA